MFQTQFRVVSYLFGFFCICKSCYTLVSKQYDEFVWPWNLKLLHFAIVLIFSEHLLGGRSK